MSVFFVNVVYIFVTAFGVTVGTSVFAGIGALINNDPPLKTMLDLARSLKIWAVAIAIGGTFSSLEMLEQGLLRGEVKSIAKQIIYILIALMGANVGYSFLKLIQRCSEIWME